MEWNRSEKSERNFQESVKRQCSRLDEQKSRGLGHQKIKSFWDSIKKIFGNQRAGIGPVNNQNEEKLTATEDTAMELRRTFFEMRHLQNQIFENYFNMVNLDVQKLPGFSQHALLEVSIEENKIHSALRNGTNWSLKDTDEIHPKMFTHIGPNFKGLPLQFYNECWRKSN